MKTATPIGPERPIRTLREALNHVERRFSQDPPPPISAKVLSGTSSPSCRYRVMAHVPMSSEPVPTACAVGCLIPDDVYSPDVEILNCRSTRVASQVLGFRTSDEDSPDGSDVTRNPLLRTQEVRVLMRLLRTIQKAHDRAVTDLWWDRPVEDRQSLECRRTVAQVVLRQVDVIRKSSPEHLDVPLIPGRTDGPCEPAN